jgi:hypothetical protein
MAKGEDGSHHDLLVMLLARGALHALSQNALPKFAHVTYRQESQYQEAWQGSLLLLTI